ncbi:phenoloxidase-activating factor 2-like isoform X2 [Phymastichus coffea]|uniref:phenoloxidase-activating factor 2-like isoform X2 n=1 Tax=Phymastichus coffea TaxID=108790 RepID=UPI00273C4C78|nr:phenoloxidase-activating factor 2-like isoform X2 [Phymastichus coffea]
MEVRINTILFIMIFMNAEWNHATANKAKDCQCVSIWQCNEKSGDNLDDEIINLRPVRSVIVRKRKDCDSILEICCDLDQIIFSETKQISVANCGIRHFEGINSSMTSRNYYETKFGEFPWTIAVLHNTADKQDEYICDGALIHRKVVLTAAHCVDGKIPERIKIRAGEWDTQSTNEKLPHQDRAVETIIIHENYNSEFFFNDVALLILNRSLKITNNVNVICLPESINEFKTTQCIISGWGLNHLGDSYEKVLKRMNLQILPRIICKRALQQSGLDSNVLLDKSLICGTDRVKNSIWKGNGGSPFVCPLKNDNQRFVQARIWIDEQLLFYNLDNTEYRPQTHIY